MKELFSITDEIEWVHRDKNGKVIRSYKSNTFWNRLLKQLHLKPRNCMTNEGFAQVAAFILADIDVDHSVYTNCDWISIGTGVVAADPTDHALGTPQGIRQAGTGTRVTTDGITNNTAQLVATFSQAIDATLEGTDAITEVGEFWHVSADHAMIMRQTFAAESMNWDAGDTLEMTIKIQVKQGA